MNSHQTDWEKNIIDNADSYSIVEWRPLDKSTKTIVKTYDEAKELPESKVSCINFDITKKRRKNEKTDNYYRSFGTY